MDMIESAAPIPHLPEIVAAATQAVGDIVFDAELGQGAEHDRPSLILIYEVLPVAVVDGYFNAFISAEFDKLGKIPDRRLTVVIIGESLNAVNADVKNGAADYGSERNEILIVSLSLGDNIAALVKAGHAPPAYRDDLDIVFLGIRLYLIGLCEYLGGVVAVVGAEFNAVQPL